MVKQNEVRSKQNEAVLAELTKPGKGAPEVKPDKSPEEESAEI